MTLETFNARRQFLKTAGLSLAGLALANPLLTLVSPSAQAASTKTLKAPPKKPFEPLSIDIATGALVAKSFTERFARIEGISANQLAQHNKLYEGYVKKHNSITQQLAVFTPEQLEDANATYHVFRELTHEQSFALNGVVLHELYFEGMGPAADAARQPSAFLNSLLVKRFGSLELYMAHLMALGKASRGWAMTGYNLRDGRLHNYGLDMHDIGMPAHVIPVLVLDVYEHAYMIDFGTNRGDYLKAFATNIDWQQVEARLAQAGHSGLG
ncbi:MAG: Fe-Mn family superoxide dismutase [Vampirovibrionales bacterium]|nr:Fe-Mn family superoxide dismutase [Vampirovibrionales bacterium]